METMMKMLLALSLGGTALAALLLLLRRILGRKIPSVFYYYAWLIVLLRFVLPLPGLMPTARPLPAASPAPVPVAVTQDAAPAVERNPVRVYREYMGTPPIRSAGGELLPAGQPGGQSAPAEADQSSSAASPALFPRVKALLLSWRFWGWVYLLGAGCASLWLFGGYFRFRRALGKTLLPAREEDLAVYRSLHEGPSPRLFRSRAVKTPMLLGLVRPMIVLPYRSYTPDMLTGILRHELTHYRRGDVAYKWFAVLVSILHWFNPFTRLFRREIDRSCELSCDEHLLRRMDRPEKQRYGELLLTLAADRSLPRSAVAMSFATEKRNLKERLVQIMTYKRTGKAGLAIMLIAILLLTGCAGALGPTAAAAPAEAEQTPPTPQPEEAAEVIAAVEDSGDGDYILVETVDELIDAIGPDRHLALSAGDFKLSDASSYGRDTGNPYCYWADCYDGYELCISGVENLTLLGDGIGKTQILTEPRYANVLVFEGGSRGLSLINFTAGHTTLPGFCAGGVLLFRDCSDIGIESCDLFGCGVLGISAHNVQNLIASNSTIRECSYGAILAVGCYDIRFQNGVIQDCGVKEEEFYAFELLEVNASTGFGVFNTEILGNHARIFLASSNSLDVNIRGCDVHDNIFGDELVEKVNINGEPYTEGWGGLFQISGASPVISGCGFEKNTVLGYGDYFNFEGESLAGVCVDEDGNALMLEDVEAMALEPFDLSTYTGPRKYEGPVLEGTVNDEGLTEYKVSSVDELLAAIGSDRVIVLDEMLYDLSEASNYGGFGSDNYYWINDFDGPGLVITGVNNLHIRGAGQDKTILQAVPRYADVLGFESCSNVSVEDLTAGHLKEAPGSCVGDVFELNNCSDVEIVRCGLFGCGVIAVNAYNSQVLSILDCELYECSSDGIDLSGCQAVKIENTVIRDCQWIGIQAFECKGLSITGCEIFRCGPSDLPKDVKPEEIAVDPVSLHNCQSVSMEDLSIHDNVLNTVNVGQCQGVTWDGAELKPGRTVV